ncbi:uncharacterized protein LOC125942282 [Dermacentor silvarum]|uniref:uncharacterized protein LOC125942282 n=1 Tax=Dermacentor silvarum TaxID=543639 RepID=UPI002100A2E1|nr:uncharacterized protein LOC125942282 [Dermacentor silvarum]
MQFRGLLLRCHDVPGWGQVWIGADTLRCFPMSGFPRRLRLHCQNLSLTGHELTHTAEQVAACRLGEENVSVLIQVFLQVHAQSVNDGKRGWPLPVSRPQTFHVPPSFRLEHQSLQASRPVAVQSASTTSSDMVSQQFCLKWNNH